MTSTRGKKPTSTVLVKNADRMITRVSPVVDGLVFRFADGVGGRIPFSELPGIASAADIAELQLPTPYMIVIHNSGGGEIEIPWDFARGHADPLYQPAVETVARDGRQALGSRVRQLRESSGLTQAALARLAGISRVTLVRLENGDYSPRFETLAALARALRTPMERLLVDDAPAKEQPE